MMADLNRALNWTIQYERDNFGNRFTTCLANIKHSVEVIIEGLSNITSVQVTACVANDDIQITVEDGTESESDDSNEEPTTEDSRARNDTPDVCYYSYKAKT